MVKSLKVGVFSRKLEDSFSSQVLLENCVMTGNKKSGALVRDGSDVSFKSCRFEGNGEYGLYVSDADATLVGCNFGKNQRGPIFQGEGANLVETS
mmetsp:Transcript_15235/g.36257  ORF Transcript_15235/g.36257 Transcript_15235/m.36257 type:complete len:95 (-) Transcript_15235:7-291(-)